MSGSIGGFSKIIKAGNGDFNGIKMVARNGFDIDPVSLVDWKGANSSCVAEIRDVTGSQLKPMPDRSLGDSLTGQYSTIGSLLHSSVIHNVVKSKGDAPANSPSSTSGSPYMSIFSHVSQHENDHETAINIIGIDQVRLDSLRVLMLSKMI